MIKGHFLPRALRLLLFLTPMLLTGVTLEQSELEIRVLGSGREMEGIFSFDIYCRNLGRTNKTLTGTIQVYGPDGHTPLGNAVIFLEIKKNQTVKERFHAFTDTRAQMGKWELEIDEVYDFTLAELEATLEQESRSMPVAPAGAEVPNPLPGGERVSGTGNNSAMNGEPAAGENPGSSGEPTLKAVTGKWSYSGNNRWIWEFSAGGNLKITDTAERVNRNVFGTYTYTAGVIEIVYDDTALWPDHFEFLGELLVGGTVVLCREN